MHPNITISLGDSHKMCTKYCTILFRSFNIDEIKPHALATWNYTSIEVYPL